MTSATLWEITLCLVILMLVGTACAGTIMDRKRRK